MKSATPQTTGRRRRRRRPPPPPRPLPSRLLVVAVALGAEGIRSGGGGCGIAVGSVRAFAPSPRAATGAGRDPLATRRPERTESDDAGPEGPTTAGWKMPWDDGGDREQQQQQQQWQWWPQQDRQQQQQQQQQQQKQKSARAAPRKKPPRVPRHPSALHEGREFEGEVEQYARSAEQAAAAKSQTATGPESNLPSKPRRPKLGVLLIDRGSRNPAANDRFKSLAESYRSSLEELAARNNAFDGGPSDGSSVNTAGARVAVRGAHTELAEPSIATALRALMIEDEVTTVVCVPYFLIPTKRAVVDVPQIVDEAIKALDAEGLLDYIESNGNGDNGNGDNEKSTGKEGQDNSDDKGSRHKMRKVQVLTTGPLETDKAGMLKVVDDLVREALGGAGDGFGLVPLAGQTHGENSDADEGAKALEEKEAEARKYANRAALLESALESKAKELTTMSNRVSLLESALGEKAKEAKNGTDRIALLESDLEEKAKECGTMANRAALMEDALSKTKGRFERERDEKAGRQAEELQMSDGQVANLTKVLASTRKEKEELEDLVGALETQREELERERNATIAELEAELASSKQDLEERRRLEANAEEREEELQNEMDRRQSRIGELEAQLAELLDANDELEGLRAELEGSSEARWNATVADLRSKLAASEQQLKELREAGEAGLRNREERVDREGGLRKATSELEARLSDLLDANDELEDALASEREEREKFEALWTEVRERAEADAAKYDRMRNESAADYEEKLEEERIRAEEWRAEWEALNATLGSLSNVAEPQTAAAWSEAEAEARIEELEADLQKQAEEHGASQTRNEERHEKLQEYLRAQLSTYYDTIQDQASKIEEYESNLTASEEQHAESMLVATNAVEASRRREEELLQTVEDLERDLAAAREGRGGEEGGGDGEGSPSRETLARREEALTAEMSFLRRELRAARCELIAAEDDKGVSSDGGGEEPTKGTKPRKQRRRGSWIWRALRPWTLFRRQL